MMGFWRATLLAVVIVQTVLLSSCGGVRNGEDAEELTVIRFDEAADTFRLADRFSRITCVQLEMTDESLLGKVRRVVLAEGNLVVLTKDYEICVFNRENGEFIRQIGSVGEGPEEFLTAQDICYDPADGIILVLDELKREFLTYKLTGEFVGRFRVDGDLPSSSSMVRAGDGTVMTCNNLLSDITDLCAFTIVHPEGLMENIDSFAPLVLRRINGMPVGKVWAEKPMSASGDELKFVKALSDTLCVIKDGKVSPLYKLDFGKRMLSKEMVMDLGEWDEECIKYCIRNNIFTSVYNMFETSRYLVIIPDVEFVEGYYWIDKEKEEGIHIGSTERFDHEIIKVVTGKSIIRMVGADENEMISCFDAEFGNDFIKAIDKNKGDVVFSEEVISAIERLAPEGNPFLIIYEH